MIEQQKKIKIIIEVTNVNTNSFKRRRGSVHPGLGKIGHQLGRWPQR